MAKAEKLTLKQIFGCLDMGYKNAWDVFSDDEKKSVNFWLLKRYISCVQGLGDKQSLAILKSNEYVNKNYNVIGTGKSGHSKLMWQLMCIACNTKKNEFHYWQPINQKGKSNSSTRILEQIYPNMKLDEVELLARILTKKEIKQLAEEYGIDDSDNK